MKQLFSSESRKAWVAAGLTAVSAAVPLFSDGVVDGADIGLVVGAFLAGLGVTFRVPNKVAPAE
ncbi:hypothetical protein [Lentzea sp. NBRC 102530]|uniref:hypothetical protein n=1 Tax=Lentzea sp. NBRC 102530 TaxID=3032201 RepID=UPI0024A36F39|nr:hypothetical protein [Lentzea sp. NBRC 102530]GLY55358.1 hypothetical protein Lesp01_90130 [Lentzea sp. NBRC 102530]